MANRNRPVQVKFRVTPEERALIGRRMEQAGTMNMAAYLRKWQSTDMWLNWNCPNFGI